jgi:hypothetical protein
MQHSGGPKSITAAFGVDRLDQRGDARAASYVFQNSGEAEKNYKKDDDKQPPRISMSRIPTCCHHAWVEDNTGCWPAKYHKGSIVCFASEPLSDRPSWTTAGQGVDQGCFARQGIGVVCGMRMRMEVEAWS